MLSTGRWPQRLPYWIFRSGIVGQAAEMHKTIYQLKFLRDFVLLLGITIPCVALAATYQDDPGFDQIPGLAYFVTFISATLGGLAGTLHRMSQHLEPGARGIKHPKIFVSANMMGGWSAGWFSFLVGTHWNTPVLLVQGLVLLSGFGGAALVERFVDRYFPAPKIQ